jgi:uncharacterized protein DUF4258
VQSNTFDKVCVAVVAGQVHVSEHAHDEAIDDGLSIIDVIDATSTGEVIEDYPTDPRGASCLALITIGKDMPVHAVWAFDEGSGRAILITVYRPDPARWSDDLRHRRRKP